MRRTNLLMLLFLLAALSGCERNPSTDSAAPSGSSVKILSTAPKTSAPLRVGDHVKLKVDVAHMLTVDSGTLGLVIQAADNSAIAQDMEVVTKGSGKTSFETEFVVPDTKAIQVFTPLSAQGQSSTSTVDMRAFKVIPE